MTQEAQRLTFKGSVSTITEFIGFAVYSILYQRSVYPSSDFKQVTRYGVPLMVSTDADLNSYLAEMLQQVAAWVTADKLRKMVLIVTDSTGETVIERWAFDIVPDGIGKNKNEKTNKKEEELRREIQAVIRQITASVAYLPLLEEKSLFDLLVYTEKDAEIPSGSWENGDPRLIPNSNEVKMRSFTTGFHRVGASVTYREELA